MIPKIIHYCWFGNKKLSKTAELCINTWKKELPDFQIKKWDKTNSPIKDNVFVKAAYKNKKWAFVADFVRFYALYNEGGIYMDTDMFVVKNFNKLLSHKCFLGFESGQTSKSVNGAIIGAEVKNEFIKNCLLNYQKQKFNHQKPITIPHILTSELKKKGLIEHNVTQTLNNEITLYDSNYFYPYPFCYEEEKFFKQYIKQETFAVHLWDYSWQNGLGYLRQRQYKKGFKYVKNTIINNPIQSISYYKQVFIYFLRYLKQLTKDV